MVGEIMAVRGAVRFLVKGLVVTSLLCAGGCRGKTESSADAQVQLQFDPDPPQVGATKVSASLRDAANQPLSAGKLDLEGNMNHAGMKPVFSTLQETQPGQYEGSIEFTMAGDWFVLVKGKLADGRLVNEQVDVPGVKRP